MKLKEPITMESFTRPFEGASSSYSTFYMINTTIEDVMNNLNKCERLSTDMPKLFLGATQEGATVTFMAFDELPDLLYELTERMNIIGYSDIDWDVQYFLAVKNGSNYDGFKAYWEENQPEYREEACWDAFIKVVDFETGEIFHTGAGAVDDEQKEYWEEIVNSH